MATRRPLVRVNGRNRQLPAGDVITGVPQKIPVYTAAGLAISITAIDAVLPVYLASGEVVGVPFNG